MMIETIISDVVYIWWGEGQPFARMPWQFLRIIVKVAITFGERSSWYLMWTSWVAFVLSWNFFVVVQISSTQLSH